MNRRRFVRLMTGAAAWPAVAYGQSNPVQNNLAQNNLEAARIGYIYTGPKQLAAARVDSIMTGLRTTYPSPQVEMVMRVTDTDPTKIEPMIAEILARNVSVLLANGPAALKAAQAATRKVPIVAIDFETDPVAAGYVQSIARPGGNVSGVFLDFPNFAGKWIELLRECVPKLSRIAVIWDSSTGSVQSDALAASAAPLGIQLDLLPVKAREDFAPAFAVARDRGAGAAVMTSAPLVVASVKDAAEQALRHRMPTITMFAEFPRTGGLLSYGPNLVSGVRQTGTMAGKILSGTPAANLPVERPSKFELTLNLHAAEALGIAIPTSVQVLAEEVIE